MVKTPTTGRFPVDRGFRSTNASSAVPADATWTGRRRSLDPQGRRALFETPVSAARDTVRSGAPTEGRQALFSSGPRRAGTVTITCSSCKERSRIALGKLGLRMLTGSVWLPGRRDGHWLRCPSCDKRTWCSIGWQS